MKSQSQQQTFLEHLVELRKRLLWSFLAVSVTTIIALIFSKKLFYLLQIPMLKALSDKAGFIATAPFEPYMIYFKIALLTGFFAATPVLFYQFWKFVSPALTSSEKKLIIPFTLTSVLLFTGGALFGYFVIFPPTFVYINRIFDNTVIEFMPKMSEYFSVAVMLLLTFGISFELPLVIFALGKLGLIDYAFIKKNRRYVIVILFILAAILTPDSTGVLQCLLALPLWILYELGGLSLLIFR